MLSFGESGELAETFTVGEPAGEVQASFEAMFGAGTVEVTASPGPNNPNEVYEVRFGGTLKRRSIPPPHVRESSLHGASERVSIEQLAEGRFDGELVATLTNMGGANIDGSTAPVEIDDELPPGLKAETAVAITPGENGAGVIPCSVQSPSHVSCIFTGGESELFVELGYAFGLAPYYGIEVRISVEVEAGAEPDGEQNQVSVSGGEGSACKAIAEAPSSCERISTGPVPGAAIERAVRVEEGPTRFGVENFELTPEESGGALATQAGSHPYQTSFTVVMNQKSDNGPGRHRRPEVLPPALAKDLRFKLPPGLVGNPTATPTCSIRAFLHHVPGGNECPADTAVGVASVYINIANRQAGLAALGFTQQTAPVFNIEPQAGEPARFGFFLTLANFGVLIDTSVRTGGDYGITSTTANISQLASLLSANVTLWGVPGDPRHDVSRGWGCLEAHSGIATPFPCTGAEDAHPLPFLDLPTSCTGPLHAEVEADSWSEQGIFHTFPSGPEPSLQGCNRLQFTPEIKVTPDGHEASKPTGLTVDVHVPQGAQLNGAGLVGSNIKDIAVTLPEGVQLNPSSADGLQACSEAQIGYLPDASRAPDELHFTPKIEAPFCADASKVATVKIKTPLLPNPLQGAVYLASPQNFHNSLQENPFETKVAMYIVAEDPVSGSLLKLPGKVTLNEATGQITSTFEDNPQLPFEDAELHFFGGERAPLATPARCGTYTTEASFNPWSGSSPAQSSSSFQITSGPNGSPCPGTTLPFAPSLTAGSPNINAGSFSPLVTTISREDGNQQMRSVQLHFAPGMSGILAGTPLCAEAQANVGTCSAQSLIGETIVSVGLGGDPFTVTGGKVYLTEKYQGAPFGLSITNPAKAGPFNLQEGRPVVVRAKIEIDPHTAALTVTTDPTGPHSIPQIIDGFPLQIKHVNVTINKAGFTFNPTSCNPMSIAGTIGSSEGASFLTSVPFQVTNCRELKFTPKFVTTTGPHGSRSNGASLSFKISYPNGAQGKESWFSEAKFDIPKQLPARLSTIQQACLAATFEKNRGACPKYSVIGHALVHTPVLPVPLGGSVYFVSYGGARFPDAVLVLDGYGVHIELHGETFINGKTGVTSATFRALPDVPFESIEVTIPTGPFSEFGANLPATDHNSFCGQKLVMPTYFRAQNGLQIKQNTKLTIKGCPTTHRGRVKHKTPRKVRGRKKK